MLNKRLNSGERKVRIVNEVVGNAVDIPRNAHRVDETEDEHDPERHPAEKR